MARLLLTWRGFLGSVLQTAESAGLNFFILLSAEAVTSFLAPTRALTILAEWVQIQGLKPMTALALMLVASLVFGCVKGLLSMIS